MIIDFDYQGVPHTLDPWRAAQDRYDSMVYRRVGQSGLILPGVSLGLWYNFGDNRPFDGPTGELGISSVTALAKDPATGPIPPAVRPSVARPDEDDKPAGDIRDREAVDALGAETDAVVPLASSDGRRSTPSPPP